MAEHSVSYFDGCTNRTWSVRRLWDLARDLPVEECSVEQLVEEMREVMSYGEKPFSWGNVALHARRAFETDLRFPIILAPEGWIMDGSHRLMKAWILRHKTIAAVRLPSLPAPDTEERSGHG